MRFALLLALYLTGFVAYYYFDHKNDLKDKTIGLERVTESKSAKEKFRFKFNEINPTEIKKLQTNFNYESKSYKLDSIYKITSNLNSNSEQNFFLEIDTSKIDASRNEFSFVAKEHKELSKTLCKDDPCNTGVALFIGYHSLSIIFNEKSGNKPLSFALNTNLNSNLVFSEEPGDFLSLVLGLFSETIGLLFLCGLILIFVGYYTYKFFTSNYDVLSSQASMLNLKIESYRAQNITFKEVAEIEEYVAKEANYFKDSFNEFKETLIEFNGTVKNCINSPSLFDIDTLIEQHTNKHILQHAPGVLTSLGIVGTFLGLSGGVQSLSLKDPDILFAGIEGLMGGMSSAFLTSILGMISSLGFIWAHKHKSHETVKAILDLQNTIDISFERANTQNILAMSLKNQQEHYESLISSLIPKSMSPEGHKSEETIFHQVKVTADNSSNTNEKLDKLLTIDQRIADAFGEEFMKRLASAVSKPMTEMLEKLDTALGNIKDQNSQTSSEVASGVKKEFDAFGEAIEKVTENVLSRQEGLNNSLDRLISGINNAVDKAQTSLKETLRANTENIERSQELKTELQGVLGLIGEQMESIKTGFEFTLNSINQTQSSASQNMIELKSQMQETSTQNQSQMNDIIKNAKAINEGQSSTLTQLSEVLDKTSSQIEFLNKVSSNTNRVIENNLPDLSASISNFVILANEETHKIAEISSKIIEAHKESHNSVIEMKSLTENLVNLNGHVGESSNALWDSFREMKEQSTEDKKLRTEFLKNQTDFLVQLQEGLSANTETTKANQNLISQIEQLREGMQSVISEYGGKIDEYNTEMEKAFTRAFATWDEQIANFARYLEGAVVSAGEAVEGFRETVIQFPGAPQHSENQIQAKQTTEDNHKDDEELNDE